MTPTQQHTDARCELQMSDGHDCGQPATGHVMATPSPIADPKPFHACGRHLDTLASHLRAANFIVTT
jgi:hypothetical protein